MASRRARRFWKLSVGADIVDAKYLMGNNETCSRNTFATTKISLCARSSYQGGVVEGFNHMAREHSEAVH
jgi:hypothetical protein